LITGRPRRLPQGVRQGGKPDLKSGDAVVKAFKEQFKENDKTIAELKKRVEDIDVKKDFDSSPTHPDTDFLGRLEDVADDEGDGLIVMTGAPRCSSMTTQSVTPVAPPARLPLRPAVNRFSHRTTNEVVAGNWMGQT
jgi:hypothetical protein